MMYAVHENGGYLSHEYFLAVFDTPGLALPCTPRYVSLERGPVPAPGRQERKAAMEAALKEKAKQLAEDFQQEWEPMTENLDAAIKAFDDLEGMPPPPPPPPPGAAARMSEQFKNITDLRGISGWLDFAKALNDTLCVRIFSAYLHGGCTVKASGPSTGSFDVYVLMQLCSLP